MLSNNVKLVIWDLDDTFWSGTLAEGAITPIEANKHIVVTLAERGIISSICSKNDHAQAEAALTGQGVWSYFVFPKIEFGPKGQNIAAIIETAGLRPENVLFIDDNILNLEEARHVSPGLMVADPRDILPGLLDLPELAGKDDRALTRLQQYKNLEVKAVERATSSVSNEEFLRSCGITVDIDYDIESQFDRIIELANRTNQLNYTKQRLEIPSAVAQFRELLATYGVTAGLVRVADKYGDYGIVGFFVVRRIPKANNLLHFVFSCRTMNMGIEQYIYERLQRPAVTIVQPVANPICPFGAVDWITEGNAAGGRLSAATSSKRLLLLGGCELLQLASMCSSNREEFVNTCRDNWLIRFDDPAFILGDRDKIRTDAALANLHYWTHQDAVQFDKALASSQIIIAALFTGVTNNLYYASVKGNIVRIARPNLQRQMVKNEAWLLDNFRPLQFDVQEKFAMLAKSLDHMAAASPPGAQRFALGVNTKKMPGSAQLAQLGWPTKIGYDAHISSWSKAMASVPPNTKPVALRHIYNAFLKDYCERTGKFVFVDVENLVVSADVQDTDPETGKFLPDHLTRRGYINIAAYIAGALENPVPLSQIVEVA